MGSRGTLARGQRAISVYGYRGVAQLAVGKLTHLRRRAPDSFDAEHGTDTAQIVRLEALGSVSGKIARFGHKYQACDPERTLTAFASLPIRFEDFTLIDVGSGKGRVLLVGAELPFRRIIGVEFASELHDIAVSNVQRARPDDPRIELVCSDATIYDWPTEPLVLVFNNPFLPPIMQLVMKQLVRSLHAAPRPVYLVLFTPADVQQVAEAVGFQRVGADVFVWRG